MDHPQAMNTLAPERYLLGEMTEDERLAFEDHYFSCAECADDVRAGGLMRDGARAGLLGATSASGSVDSAESHGFRATTRPASGLAGGRRQSGVVELARSQRRWFPAVAVPWVPWAVAATFAILAGSESLVLQRSLRPDTRLIALAPATLRPASRGQDPVVSRGPGGVVTLAVDLGGTALDSELEYELRSADRALVASGRVPAPQAGSPLFLMVSGTLLQPSEHYVLTVANPGKAGLPPSSYRFTVGAQ
jgi:Putative zinc-finger